MMGDLVDDAGVIQSGIALRWPSSIRTEVPGASAKRPATFAGST
jgi:hypothetical protein